MFYYQLDSKSTLEFVPALCVIDLKLQKAKSVIFASPYFLRQARSGVPFSVDLRQKKKKCKNQEIELGSKNQTGKREYGQCLKTLGETRKRASRGFNLKGPTFRPFPGPFPLQVIFSNN